MLENWIGLATLLVAFVGGLPGAIRIGRYFRERPTARLRAWYVHDSAGLSLYVANDGRAEASEVTVRINDSPVPERPAAGSGQPSPRRIGPGSQMQYRLSTELHRAICRLSWRNPNGKRAEYETEL